MAPDTQIKEEPKQLSSKTKSTIPKKLELKKTESIGTPKSKEVKPAPAQPKLSDIKLILDDLTATVLDHTRQIVELQEALIRKRKPTQNSKVQIRDKQIGKVYPSKNNVYQSLLKSGELKDLVNKGVFGDNPEKNTFGWYALVKEWPDRFEEVKPEQAQADGKPQ